MFGSGNDYDYGVDLRVIYRAASARPKFEQEKRGSGNELAEQEASPSIHVPGLSPCRLLWAFYFICLFFLWPTVLNELHLGSWWPNFLYAFWIFELPNTLKMTEFLLVTDSSRPCCSLCQQSKILCDQDSRDAKYVWKLVRQVYKLDTQIS